MNNQKKSMSSKINLLFSAFLVLAFVICSYFIDSFALNIQNETLKNAVPVILFAVFGLFLFYATRVGDGKPVYRLSLSALLLIVLPGLLIFIAYIAEGMPYHEQLVSNGANMAKIAACALGYGLPYTFISGFELSPEDSDTAEEEKQEDESEQFENNSADTEQDDNINEDHSADIEDEAYADIASDADETAVPEASEQSIDEKADTAEEKEDNELPETGDIN